jgi:hypothetical protein
LTLETILTELKSERDRMNRAIAALEGTSAAGPAGSKSPRKAAPRKRKRMSAEARGRISDAKRKWWAERKKKSKGT